MADEHVRSIDVGLRAVQSIAAFAEACNQLRAGLSYSDLRKAARPRSLPQATLSDLLNGKSTPSRDTVITFLTACGLDDAAQRPWLAAWERAATARQPHPPGAVRARQARPRLLGVHAAIQTPGDTSDLPLYVPRDFDAELHAALTGASTQGGFVLLLGTSLAGKTRALYEAVRTALPEWWLLQPADAPAVIAHAMSPTPRTVLWMDELQRYLDHPGGLPASAMSQLIAGGTVAVTTLWSSEYNLRTERPQPGEFDSIANDRVVLHMADVIRVPETFSRAERQSAEMLAASDPRIRIALDTSDAGFTQVLAAGPALVQRWEQPSDFYGKAVISAALDARRVGARGPLSRDFLTTAAPAYLTSSQQAMAPFDWFERAISYAVSQVLETASCLIPVAGGMGQIAGWISADYLHQHAQVKRRTVVVPPAAWQALVDHHHYPDDLRTLAEGAEARGQTGPAEHFYRRAMAAGDQHATYRLTRMFMAQCRRDEAIAVARPAAHAGHRSSALQLVELLTGLRSTPGTLDGKPATVGELLRRKDKPLRPADGGDEAIAVLRPHISNRESANVLVRVLAYLGRVTELRECARNGTGHASTELADLLAKLGKLDELRELAAAGSSYAARVLARRLAEMDEVDEALAVLRKAALSGDLSASSNLAQLLRTHERLDELRERENVGDTSASSQLNSLLAEKGQEDELKSRAEAGSRSATYHLSQMLVAQNRVEEAIALVERQTGASELLAELYRQQGRTKESVAILRHLAATTTFPMTAAKLARLMFEQGAQDEAFDVVRPLADDGDPAGIVRLVELYEWQGKIDEAIAAAERLASAGHTFAETTLADVLERHGRVDKLREHAAAASFGSCQRMLIKVLASQNRVDELEQEVAAGTFGAAERLAVLLTQAEDQVG